MKVPGIKVALWLVVPALVLIMGVPAQAAEELLKSPQPGEVYKEFTRVMSSGHDWRVTDPNAPYSGSPHNSPSTFLPNPKLPITINDLQGAVRAEAVIDVWGGHVGTIGKQFRLNNNPWIDIPELETTPTRGECYTQQLNAVVDIPLAHLVPGQNILEGTSGGQTCYNFGWGQWGWYIFTVRVYYDPQFKQRPTGSILSPAPGETIGEDPTITVEAQGDGAGIDRVEVFASYEGYDSDGDGVFTGYHHSYQRARNGTELEPRHHVGTATGAPYEVVWDTELVPNQPYQGIRLVARIRDDNGVWYVTEEVRDLSLQRSGSVRLYRPLNVPERYWVRTNRRTKQSTVEIPANHDLSTAESVNLFVRTWNGIDGQAEPGQNHYTKVNGWTAPNYGENHFYSFDVLEMPLSTLQNGSNTIKFYSESSHHGIEILWPGPAVLVRYRGSLAVCGDDILDPGEECDDGNLVDGDGCSANCLEQFCGDGQLGGNEECDDGNNINGDGCDENCLFEICTNGVLQIDEECDDGNLIDNDVCGNDCLLNCGDGQLGDNEECDDGNNINGDGCDENCLFEICTNGVLQIDEECDDGNLIDNDGCDNDCVLNFCGDGQVNNGEDCEDGNLVNGDGCDENCLFETCGNSVVQINEECDDGNLIDDDTCSNGCLLNAQCPNVLSNGDFSGGTLPWVFYTNGSGTYSVVGDEAEVAITTEGSNVQLKQKPLILEGNTLYRLTFRGRHSTGRDVIVRLIKDKSPYTNYGLNQTVDLTSVMQSFSVEFTTIPGTITDGRFMLFMGRFDQDGTTYYFDDMAIEKVADCQLSVCGDGIVGPGEECDEGSGNSNAPDAYCRPDCILWGCGDGVVDTGEECDDGNTTAGDGCDAGCILETVCGDGIMDPGEECDDGNLIDDDVCSNDCRLNAQCPNAVSNGDFSGGKPPWGFYTNGSGTYSVVGDEAEVAITTEGSNVQLKQKPLILEGNTLYRLTFRGRHSTGRDVIVRLIKDKSPYNNYGLNQTVDLTSVMQSFSIEFRTIPGTITDGRFMFFMGRFDQDGTTYYFDDVAIEKVADCQLSVCGDGMVDLGEECDDGNTIQGDGCDASCGLESTCGDGIVDSGEQCDDGNLIDDDDCSNRCLLNEQCPNVLTNGDFSGGTSPWRFYTNGSGTYSVVGDEARVAITTQGTNVQLFQPGLVLEGSTLYRVRFRAKHSTGRDVLVKLIKHTAPYTNCGLQQMVNLTDTTQTFNIEFTTIPDTMRGGRLMFFMGPYDQDGTTYYFDDVAIEKVADCQ